MIVKAVVWTRYGPPEVLQLKEVPKPEPKDDEVLIKVHAATVTAGDCEFRRLQLPMGLGFFVRFYAGLTRPKRITVLGQELSGEIEAVGKDVKLFEKGEGVFGSPGFQMGAYAEYICLQERSEDAILVKRSEKLTHEEAATIVVGGLESLHYLRKAKIQKGEKVLINGAGGSIGTFGIQLAKYYGAEVTAVDSAGKLDMMSETGADHVIDYTKEDFTRSGRKYDVIFDVIGRSPFSGSMGSLRDNGRYLIANYSFSKMVKRGTASKKGGRDVIMGATDHKAEDLLYLQDLVGSGKIRTVIDRRYPLEKTAEAHKYVESGQKKGNVIITVVPDKRK